MPEKEAITAKEPELTSDRTIKTPLNEYLDKSGVVQMNFWVMW